MTYYFLHPKTFKVCGIHNGRSTWEDHIDKAEFVVVKVLGPAMEHYEEATRREPTEREWLAKVLENMANPNDFNQATCHDLKRAAEILLGKE